MNLTRQFFDIALKFQNDRAAARDRYRTRMTEIEPTMGSNYYNEESHKARTEMEDTIARLREYCAEDLNIVLDDMRKANNRRPMQAPTDGQVNIIRMLKMKQNVTRDDMNAAANACRDSGICLSTLDEIAQEKKVLGFSSLSYSDNSDLSSTSVAKIIDTLADMANDFVKSDRALAARIGAERNEHQHGIVTDELKLPERRRFNSEQSCFEAIANIDSDVLAGLQNAVNS